MVFHKKYVCLQKQSRMEQITPEQEREWVSARMKMVGMNVKKVRLEKGWSQAELAYLINTSPTVINSIENKPCYNAKIGTLMKLARVLGTAI